MGNHYALWLRSLCALSAPQLVVSFHFSPTKSFNKISTSDQLSASDCVWHRHCNTVPYRTTAQKGVTFICLFISTLEVFKAFIPGNRIASTQCIKSNAAHQNSRACHNAFHLPHTVHPFTTQYQQVAPQQTPQVTSSTQKTPFTPS